MKCLFCNNLISKSSIEHIVPESLGNVWYVLPSGVICDKCNGNFSQFEDKAISNTQLGFIRTLNGIKTKKGKPGSFKINNIEGKGNDNYQKNEMTFYGIEEKDIVSRNFKNNTFDISIPDFHKSEMATAKMLLKMALESIAKSQKQILLKYNFIELKNYINNISTQDWPFIVTKILKLYDFKSVPKFNDKYNLNRIKCKLLLFEFSEDILLFEFQYDYISLVINLLDRTYSWLERYFQLDNLVSLYPTYLNKKPKSA